MSKKQITWGTPKRVAKAVEPIPLEPIIKKNRKLKYCKKTKGEHPYVEKRREVSGMFVELFGKYEWLSYQCPLCGKKAYKAFPIN